MLTVVKFAPTHIRSPIFAPVWGSVGRQTGLSPRKFISRPGNPVYLQTISGNLLAICASNSQSPRANCHQPSDVLLNFPNSTIAKLPRLKPAHEEGMEIGYNGFSKHPKSESFTSSGDLSRSARRWRNSTAPALLWFKVKQPHRVYFPSRRCFLSRRSQGVYFSFC